jgi:hypothetical protein
MVSRYLTTREVAERTGLPLDSIRAMMDPAHPECIPNVNVPTKPTTIHPHGRPRYRVAEADLEVWLAAHSVRGAEYDPSEDADSELTGGTNMTEEDDIDELDPTDPDRRSPRTEDDINPNRQEGQYMADAEWRGLSDHYPPDPVEP